MPGGKKTPAAKSHGLPVHHLKDDCADQLKTVRMVRPSGILATMKQRRCHTRLCHRRPTGARQNGTYVRRDVHGPCDQQTRADCRRRAQRVSRRIHSQRMAYVRLTKLTSDSVDLSERYSLLTFFHVRAGYTILSFKVDTKDTRQVSDCTRDMILFLRLARTVSAKLNSRPNRLCSLKNVSCASTVTIEHVFGGSSGLTLQMRHHA